MVETSTYRYNWDGNAIKDRITALDFFKFIIASPANSSNSLFVSTRKVIN